MFLGQIYTSLRDKTPFHMSSGKQLRELHHVDDDVLIIEAALRKGTIKQIVISHGKPLQLNEVADYLFNSFGLRELLRKNVLPDNPYDNYSKIFAASPNLDVISHRDPLKSIKDIFAKLLR
jgi:nucleoside-diphosphate-sugar epimerase